MDDQNEAWRRLTDARLKILEQAIEPPRVRRTRAGKPVNPHPWEPGDRRPITRWLATRVYGIELLLRLILDADRDRSDDFDFEDLETLITPAIVSLLEWRERQVEPDFATRETMAVIEAAGIVLLELHHWPLAEG